MLYRSDKLSREDAIAANGKIRNAKLSNGACVSTMYCPNCGQGWTDSICLCSGLRQCEDCGWSHGYVPVDIVESISIKYVLDVIEQEGFDYTFAHYDNFDEVKSEEFQKLKEKYLAARKELVEFLGVDV